MDETEDPAETTELTIDPSPTGEMRVVSTDMPIRPRPPQPPPPNTAQPDIALRFNEGKVEYEQLLWFRPALDAFARHCERGRAKYPDNEGTPNWLLGGKPDTEYVNAMMRHIMAYHEGELYDGELGTHHMAAVMWNAAALITLHYYDHPDCIPPQS